MGKGADDDDRGMGNPGDPDREELELQAREDFPEEVACKRGLEKRVAPIG